MPVPRRRRKDGWDPITQRKFIEVLADTGSVTDAAYAVDRSVQSAYALRRAPDAANFAAAWAAAITHAGQRLLDEAFERAVNGEDVPVFNADGRRIASKRRYSDRMMMFLLRAYHPDRFARAYAMQRGHAVEHEPEPVDATPQARSLPGAPVAAALLALEPAEPLDPRTVMPPHEFEAFDAMLRENEESERDFVARYPAEAARQRAQDAAADADYGPGERFRWPSHISGVEADEPPYVPDPVAAMRERCEEEERRARPKKAESRHEDDREGAEDDE